MVQRITSAFLFYRRYIIASLLANTLLLLMGIEFFVSATIKLLCFGLLLFIFLNTKQKYKLTFYHNLSVSTYYLFGTSVVIDLFLLFIFYLIFGYVI